MNLKGIREIPFPAVTLCYDVFDWKWPGIVNAIVQQEQNNSIAAFIMTNNKKSILYNAIMKTESGFKKSKAYTKLKNHPDIEIIHNVLPKGMQRVAKLMHFIAFSEQNTTYPYKIKSFLQVIWKQQLQYMLLTWNTSQVGQTIESNICNGLFYHFNTTKHCLDWKSGNCNSIEDSENQTMFSNWCMDCFSKNCLSSTIGFKQPLFRIYLVERYITKQNVLDSLMAVEGQFIGNKLTDSLYEIDEAKVVKSWYHLNGGRIIIDDDLISSVAEKQSNETYSLTNLDSPEIKQKLATLFSKPDVQGKNQRDYVLVPLCSFGNMKMKECKLFAEHQYNLAKKQCYTFNGNFSNPVKGGRVGPNHGLSMLVSFRVPRDIVATVFINSIDLILHEPGVAADLHYRTNTFMKLNPGFHYLIGAEATVIGVTETLKSVPIEKRNCILNPMNGKYHHTNCYLKQLTEAAIKTCNCIPWYMYHTNIEISICNGDGFACFEKIIEDEIVQQTTHEECLNACSFIKYTSNMMDKRKLVRNKYDYDEIKANSWGYFLELYDFESFPYQSMVQINFADPYATEITQDAKVTFADMVGSIGGTFGVFLGVSFVSLVDELADWVQWCMRSYKK